MTAITAVTAAVRASGKIDSGSKQHHAYSANASSQRQSTSTVYVVFTRFLVMPLLNMILGKMARASRERLDVVVTPTGQRLSYGVDDVAPINGERVVLLIDAPLSFSLRMLIDRKMGLGEGYMAADWRALPSPQAFMGLLIRARKAAATERGARSHKKTQSSLVVMLSKIVSSILQHLVVLLATVVGKLVRLANYIDYLRHENSVENSQRNISEHYDLGNEMFALFLDPSMTYSCALFDRDDPAEIDTREPNPKLLQDAQLRKYDAILDRLELKADDHVLEIGCGWAACAIRAVQRSGCSWTGLTLSKEQLAYGQEQVRRAGLEERITLKLLDYREERGTYSAVVSIEMIEAVGHKYLPVYFSAINSCLRPGGRAVIQAITCPDSYYETYCRSSDFIKKHIFPGGHMPSEGAMRASLPDGLSWIEKKPMGQHYATTLDLWHSAWVAQERSLLSLGMPVVFYRKWRFYFGLCSALFRHEHINVIQMELVKDASANNNNC